MRARLVPCGHSPCMRGFYVTDGKFEAGAFLRVNRTSGPRTLCGAACAVSREEKDRHGKAEAAVPRLRSRARDLPTGQDDRPDPQKEGRQDCGSDPRGGEV